MQHFDSQCMHGERATSMTCSGIAFSFASLQNFLPRLEEWVFGKINANAHGHSSGGNNFAYRADPVLQSTSFSICN